ncbi:MAG TPA: 16S rRNA (cytidine(1402)-2'-O)-methyltransferase [Roseiflexaceae bacterium]
MGTLYLVSTPIGNLEDITLRALRVLREASLIAAENPRHIRRLLERYEIDVPCLAYHEHSKLARLDDVLTALANGDVALVADAGTPAMSAPGFELVNACIAACFAVVPIPGPSAPIAALVASGLPADQFTCVGALPPRGPARRALLHSLADAAPTLVCFEEAHRIVDVLADMLAILGDRRIAVGRELTRPHEQFRRERISEALAHFDAHRPRGEFTLVVEGRRWPAASRRSKVAAQPPDQAGERHDEDPLPSEAEVAARLRALRDQGKSGSAAARQVARDLGLNKSLVYQIWIGLDQEPRIETQEP